MDRMADGGSRRSPMQGGLPPAGVPGGDVVEIACDESGFSGTNLLRSTEPVITHASTDLRPAEADTLITALRAEFRLSPHELKSGHFLRRPGAGEAAAWFLAALPGRARVHLVDKEFFLVTRIIDLLLTEPSYTAGTHLAAGSRAGAALVWRAGRPAGGPWTEFLAAFEDMVRPKRRPPARPAADRFLRARDALLRAAPGSGPVLARLDPAHLRRVLARLDGDDRSIPPPLEPMLPALAETILHWSRPPGGGRRRVLVIHDEQSALTAGRLDRLGRALADPETGVSPLAGLVMADSRDDPRVQIADLLAGIARRRTALLPPALLSPVSLRCPSDQGADSAPGGGLDGNLRH
ncbi:DUF3800 domain-containing protein [Actinoplanes sp. G11-F43]|uniref:DUF3800 domain-containing protein n=1 Tax=Actinoplanes sp. G11-F43 TaxID=3424130 RepID=UPI003D326D13